MSYRFPALSLLGAALTANALRPITAPPLAVPGFFAGWLAGELAPHNLAITVAGTAAHLRRHGVRDRGDRIGLAASAASVAGLALLIDEGRRARGVVEEALREALGDRHAEMFDKPSSRTDLTTPWRQVALPFLPFRSGHPDVEVVRDVQYVGRGGRHRLDVYRRRDAGHGHPVLMQLHGGAWTIGHKQQQGIPLMLHLAARGWICVAPNYRLSPRATWPDHLVDVKRALAWVRREIPAYGGDPGFVAVTGGSAGGHLAALTALTPNRPALQPGFEDADTSVQACIPHYGVYDIANTLGTLPGAIRRDRLLAPLVFKSDPRRDPEPYEQASPLLQVGEHAPPFFVIHGEHDSLVPVTEARAFVARLRERSAEPVVYAELPGAQHAFDIFPSIRSAHVVRGVELFLRYALVNRAAAPSVG